MVDHDKRPTYCEDRNVDKWCLWKMMMYMKLQGLKAGESGKEDVIQKITQTYSDKYKTASAPRGIQTYDLLISTSTALLISTSTKQ